MTRRSIVATVDRHRRQLLSAGLALAIAPLVGCERTGSDLPAIAPELALPHLDGAGTWTSASATGLLLVNVWASWCAPCRAEMASLEQLHRRHAGSLQVIGIAVDRDVRLAHEFLLAQRLTFLNLHDPDQARVRPALGIRVLPTTLLLDASRRIVGRAERAEDWASAERVAWIEQHAAMRLQAAARSGRASRVSPHSPSILLPQPGAVNQPEWTS